MKGTDLLPTAFLQPVDHLLKLQLAELHFLFQLIHKHVVVRVQVVVGLLRVQAESYDFKKQTNNNNNKERL